MKNFYEILGVAPASSTEIIKKKFKAEISKNYEPPLTKKELEQRNQELIAAYQILINAEHRKRYDELLLSGDTESFHTAFTEKWCPIFSASSTSLHSGAHKLEFHTQTLFDSIGQSKGKFLVKDSFSPFLIYLDESTDRLNKLKKDPLYTAVAEKMNSLSAKIKESFNTLDNLSEKTEVMQVLNSCTNLLAQAQKDPIINSHRGFLRRTPVFSQISYALDVTLRAFNFLLCTFFAPLLTFRLYTPPYKNEPYYGLFRQEKTKTASEVDALANDVQSYISAITPGL